jgi:N-acetylneuraminic acid mutarotase
MSRIIAQLLVLVFLTASCIIAVTPVSSASQDSWASKAPMHAARAYLGVAVVNGKIYAIGGDEGSEIGNAMTGTSMTYQVVNITEEYDPNLDKWAFKAPMPTARAQFGTAAYQNKIYCMGGYSGATIFVGPESYNWKTEYYDIGANEVYDPATDTWQTRASMPTPRFSAATNIANGKIYVIGGHTMTDLWTTFNLTEVYDPETETWTTKAPAPYKVSSSASAVIDNKIYVIGVSPSSTWENVIQIYDPANDSWSVGASSPVGHSATAGATTGLNAPKRIYFFDENRTDVYDPADDSWMIGTSAPTPRLIARAAVIDDMFYVIGGRTGQWGYMTFMYPSTLNEQYTPIGYGTPDSSYDVTAPEVTVVSPENKTYYKNDIPLNFTVNEEGCWMRYKLDNETAAEISGNATITGLSFGSHNLTVYATDDAGNTGASQTIHFTIAEEPEPEPFPTTLVIAPAIVAVIGVGLLVYFKKHNGNRRTDDDKQTLQKT